LENFTHNPLTIFSQYFIINLGVLFKQGGFEDMTKIIMHGLGRLSSSVIAAVDDGQFTVVAGIRSKLQSNFNFPVYTDINGCTEAADVIVDCSTASTLPALLDYAVTRKLPLVICTTGFDSEALSKIHEAAAHIPIFLSANMSLGVNLAAKLAGTAAKALANAGFDIEITERHHNQKLDAPSGTAILLANSITSAIGEQNMVCGRSGMGKRQPGEIGIHAICGGTIVGEHTVIFAGPDEIIEIKHAALSREVFARGALAAAKFIANQSAGLYNMDNLLELE
jgi:4-hydroxy-tetrahydrodipicolinate reductase